MTCCRKVSTAGKPKPKTKTAPSGAVLEMPACGLFAHRLHEILVARGLAALDDGDGLDLAALHGEDGDLGVLAVAFVVERDRAGRAGEAESLQVGQVLLRIRGVRLLHRLDEEIGRVVREGRVQDRI